jgi:hypothetical protein
MEKDHSFEGLSSLKTQILAVTQKKAKKSNKKVLKNIKKKQTNSKKKNKKQF